jgi:ribosomal protein S26
MTEQKVEYRATPPRCQHDGEWAYDTVAHRIRCAECGRLVTCDQAVRKFNATRAVGSDLIAAGWNEVIVLRAELATWQRQQCATCSYAGCKMRHQAGSPLPDRGCYAWREKVEA